MRFSFDPPPRRAPSAVALACLACLAALTPGPVHAALTLPVLLDDFYDGAIDNTVVGSGTFTYGVDPGDGIYTAAQLGGVSYSLTILGVPYTEANDVTVAFLGHDTLYSLSSSGGMRRVQFIPDGNASLFLYNPPAGLVEFDFYGYPGAWTGFGPGGNAAGDYLIEGALSQVPEPGAIAFDVLAACSVLGLVARKRRKA